MSQPLDSKQLRAFAMLARTGSFTLAAKELHLSQSAVSHSMKALEQDVGCRLLDRMGKKVFLTAPLHPWAAAGAVTRSEIPRQNYVLYNKNSYTFRMVEEYFRREGMVLNTVIELGSMDATKELVKLGLGVSILAPWIARKEIEEGSLVALPLGRKKLQRRWGILHWRGKRLNLAEKTFIGLCKSARANP